MERREQRRRLAVLAEADAALGEQDDGIAILRRLGHDALELGRGLPRAPGLLQRDPEVEPHRDAPCVDGESVAVAGDRVLVASLGGQHGAEVREGLDVAGLLLQEAAVGVGRGVELASLMKAHGLRKQRSQLVRIRPRGGGLGLGRQHE